ncbi:replication initiator protein [Sigmofec virus UA08Rod_5645]|uniref:Replication initiator protein n=1 Tax=Sigmofec virus UA08Rod_5645 TaxID=2929433 RepID=A0A976N1C1_9VIRU|nr:replication initiator protein [Sigmofec virus UA08Rod_5645]
MWMPCYHPLIAVDVGQRSPAGKPLYRIAGCPPDLRPGAPGSEHVRFLDITCGFAPCGSDRGFPYTIVPCGKCVGCRMEYSRQWANRCMLELEYHDSAYFVTLTYDDYHVPQSYYADPDTGEAQVSLTLCKRDLQLFMKRLRARFSDDNIRFFACGEYGPSTWRPHYHLIIFGLHLNDLVWKGKRRGNDFYASPSLERCWSTHSKMTNLFGEECVTPLAPIGFVEVGEVTWESCAYTARYIMKKLKGADADFYDQFGLTPPFTLMSRNPGLARQWYEDHPHINEYEYINLKTPTGGLKFRPPQYYTDLFDGDFPEESKIYKENRKRLAEAATRLKLQRTDMSYLEYLAVEENKLKSRTKSLLREEI